MKKPYFNGLNSENFNEQGLFKTLIGTLEWLDRVKNKPFTKGAKYWFLAKLQPPYGWFVNDFVEEKNVYRESDHWYHQAK